MNDPKLSTAYILSILIGLLIAIASAGGLLLDGLYSNNLWAASQFQGSDLVRLVIVVPLLFAAIFLARKGSLRALLIWLGILWLPVYDYAFYLFGAAFNEFFLIYVALFSLSILSLLFALPHLNASLIKSYFSEKTPTKWIAAYLAFIALFLGGLWISQTLNFVFSGQAPQSLQASGHITEIVFALDLSLLAPGLLLGAIWLWKGKPWGYILAALMLVKGTLYPLALLGMGVFAARAGVTDAGQMTIFWLAFAFLSLLASISFFGSLRQNQQEGRLPLTRPETS
jgi:hypothetical protein